jgi:hypothetical protein
VCSGVWWQEWCEGDRLLGNCRIALGCAGTENPLPPAISPPLPNVFDLGAVPMEKTAPVVGSLDVLRRRPDRLTKRRGNLTRLRYALAPESGHSMKDKTAGMWDYRAEYLFVVVQGAPLGHDGLSKWNQQWNDRADSRTENWLYPSHFALRCPNLRSVALLCYYSSTLDQGSGSIPSASHHT